MIVFNDVTQPGAGFDVDTNIAALIDRHGGCTQLPLMRSAFWRAAYWTRRSLK